jgi:teichuronic acid biosynthesis glycosyltransferase TuaC
MLKTAPADPTPSEQRLLVFSSLFPSEASPTSGTFIRERMFRVAEHIPIVVVAPQAWSPIDALVRLYRKSFRPQSVNYEEIGNIKIYRPKFFCVPGFLKRFDGHFMAWGSKRVVDKIVKEFKPTLVDSHFAFPDGFAASLLARRHKLPLTITLRGSKDEWLIGTPLEPLLKEALRSSTQLISVSESLKQDVAVRLLRDEAKCEVVGNGVDLQKFTRVDKVEARTKLGISQEAKVIISVGGLVERKGFHRIIPLIKQLKVDTPNIVFLIVGGGVSHGDMTGQLKKLAVAEGVASNVHFCGQQLPENLKWYYGAADVFALATAHEGWANVFLEAMACGLPVVTTLVGGNKQVVCSDTLGILTPFWNSEEFYHALKKALRQNWDREAIVQYAQSNSWDQRVQQLLKVYDRTVRHQHPSTGKA